VFDLLAAEPQAPRVVDQRLSKYEHHGRNRADAEQQQQQLFDADPAAVFALAGEQKLHRRPADVTLPDEVDQVDQHRQRDERQAPEQQWIREGHDGNDE
jgi:hypothetical protein